MLSFSSANISPSSSPSSDVAPESYLTPSTVNKKRKKKKSKNKFYVCYSGTSRVVMYWEKYLLEDVPQNSQTKRLTLHNKSKPRRLVRKLSALQV